MRNAKRLISAACLCLSIVLSACGGGSGDNDQSTGGQVDDDLPLEDSGLGDSSYLGMGTTITGELAQGLSRIYRVDSGAHISLFTSSGDADIFIFDNLDEIKINELATNEIYDNEAVLCWSAWRFKEDVCTASVSDGEMFALVHGSIASSFNITAVAECTTDVINEWVYRGLNDFYFYADQVPIDDPGNYDDPQDLIAALRFEPLDSYSGIRDSATQTAFFDEGVQFGLGYYWQRDSQGNLRISLVFEDSPFGRAGIKRGDIALTLGGEPLDDTMTTERFNELRGSRENPVVSDWTFIDGDTGQTKAISVLIADYQINTVVHASSHDVDGIDGSIGYIVLSNFIEPSRRELDQIIENFVEIGVTELILDLRYNGGGRSFVSRQLASQIGASRVQGMTYALFEHNNSYSSFNFTETFPEYSPILGLDRLVVLTTDRTASASESLINMLRPYMDVITIGSKTEGKAFRSYGRQFCGKTLNLMQVQGVNASGVSVAGGIPADCFAQDDLARNFGQQSGALEGMFQKGVDYLVNGTCDVETAMARQEPTADSLLTDERVFSTTEDAVPGWR